MFALSFKSAVKKKGQSKRRNQKVELCKSTPSSSGQGSISTVLTPLSPCSKELLQSFADQFSFTFLNSSSNKSCDPLSHFPPPVQKAQTNPCFHRNDGCKVPQEKNWISFLIFCNFLSFQFIHHRRGNIGDTWLLPAWNPWTDPAHPGSFLNLFGAKTS